MNAPRCLASLIEAIDEAEYPPTSNTDLAGWLQRWRAIEKMEYSDQDEGERKAAKIITRSLLRSLVAGKLYRSEYKKQHEHQRVRRNLGRRLPVGVVTVQRNKSVSVVSFGEATMEAWDLFRFASADVFSPDDVSYLRIIFNESAKSYFQLSFQVKAKPFYLRCGSILAENGIAAGHYRCLPVDAKMREFIVEFQDGPLKIRASKNEKLDS